MTAEGMPETAECYAEVKADVSDRSLRWRYFMKVASFVGQVAGEAAPAGGGALDCGRGGNGLFCGTERLFMRWIRDPQQQWMFDPFDGVLSEMARRRILAGWQGVFRSVVLKLLPVGELARHFSAEMGCPTKELYSMAGLVFLADFLDWNALEAADAYQPVENPHRAGPDGSRVFARLRNPTGME